MDFIDFLGIGIDIYNKKKQSNQVIYNKKKQSNQVIYNILVAARDQDLTKTKLISKARLSTGQVHRYLPKLLEADLLQFVGEQNRP